MYNYTYIYIYCFYPLIKDCALIYQAVAYIKQDSYTACNAKLVLQILSLMRVLSNSICYIIKMETSFENEISSFEFSSSEIIFLRGV